MKYADTDTGKPQKPRVIDRRGDTDDAEMIAHDAHQQTMYETSDQEEGNNKPYPEITAAPEKGEPNTYDGEFAADATLATYDEEFAAAATYNEELAAATTLERGSPRGHN
jgi:hypothetical protein